MKHFIIVDMQKDFTTGALKNDAAVAIIPKIKKHLEAAKKRGDNIIFTMDTHTEDYMNTSEGKHLPVVHCIENTDGWQIIDDFKEFFGDTIFIHKKHFGYDNWAKIIKPGDEVTICGTCTAICVASNALAIKMIDEVEVTVLSDCCACVTPESHEAALATMKMCQCNVTDYSV